jgi:nitroreductase
MELDHALATTRAVRKRLDLDRPVERSVIEECLRLALQAPNGSNRQIWRWIVVDDPATRAAMADIYRSALQEYAGANTDFDRTQIDDAHLRIGESVMYLAEHLHEVPALVVPVATWDLDGAHLFHHASIWGSILPAVWSFMLALRGRGLGSAWTTVHLWKAAEMAELLGLPPGWTQAGLFPVAYTIGTDFKPGPRHPVEEVLHWNRFETDPQSA